mmetsp:Transcript_37913/g.67782  ORF Transcript_37913/g.67782 Transcript_37913/m.67782 type:complete len:205 (-) Transcript_37913:596-1210(-)
MTSRLSCDRRSASSNTKNRMRLKLSLLDSSIPINLPGVPTRMSTPPSSSRIMAPKSRLPTKREYFSWGCSMYLTNFMISSPTCCASSNVGSIMRAVAWCPWPSICSLTLTKCSYSLSWWARSSFNDAMLLKPCGGGYFQGFCPKFNMMWAFFIHTAGYIASSFKAEGIGSKAGPRFLPFTMYEMVLALRSSKQPTTSPFPNLTP